MRNDQSKTHCDVKCFAEETPVVRYTSALVLYEEALESTGWINRYWSPVAQIEKEPVVRGFPIYNSAFGLEIDGQSLHRGWDRW